MWQWRFLADLSDELTSLRVLSDAYGLDEALPALTRLTNLRELDIDLGVTCPSPQWFIIQNREPFVRPPAAEELTQAFQALPSLQRVGVHAASQSYHIRFQDPGRIEVCMTLNVVANEPVWAPCVEDQMDEATRPRLSSLVVYFRGISASPSLHGCSVLRELVLAHCSPQFGLMCVDTFEVTGLEAVAGTLTRLVVNTDRILTLVHVPPGLRLQSLMLVCPGALAVVGSVAGMARGLKEALFGYAVLLEDSAELVFGISSRLSNAVLEVVGGQPLKQALSFTHAALVGQWWHGVRQGSMASDCLGSLCCRVRVWSHHRLCPAHTLFPRYGIVPTHDDRDVRLNQLDNGYYAPPAWHSPPFLERQNW
jgi:hypothetical protein